MQKGDTEKQQTQNQEPSTQTTELEQTDNKQSVKKEEDILEIRSQLKQKIKQNKVLSTKNSKLQARYVELFRQQKALKKDYDVFVSVLEQVIPEFEKKELGAYDADTLKTKWHEKQSRTSQKIEQMIQEASLQKIQLQKRIKSEMEEKIRNIDLESQLYLENLNKQLELCKKQNKSMGEQLIDLDKKLDLKDNEVSKLTKQKLKLQHMLNQYKVKQISDELGGIKNTQHQKAINERNQFLALRQQVDNLMDKRDQLRAQLKQTKASAKSMEAELQKKNSQIAQLEKSVHSLAQQKRKPKIQPEQIHNSQPQKQDINQIKNKKQQYLGDPLDKHEQDDNIHHFSMDDDYVHRQYVKNLFIRYLKCYRNGDQTQAQILQNIILTILKFSIGEREQINIKKKGWF